jgi:hypothetical protein
MLDFPYVGALFSIRINIEEPWHHHSVENSAMAAEVNEESTCMSSYSRSCKK